MDTHSIINSLENEWDFEHGFLGRLRKGRFDEIGFERLTRVLLGIGEQQQPDINRRIVSLLWYMPIFMQWQRERVLAEKIDIVTFDKSVNLVQGEIERILGVP